MESAHGRRKQLPHSNGYLPSMTRCLTYSKRMGSVFSIPARIRTW